MAQLNNHTIKMHELPSGTKEFRFLNFLELIKLPVCAGKIKDKIGKVTDIVFKLSEPFPEAIGIYIEHGWGKPTEFVQWDKVIKIEDDAIFVQKLEEGKTYPPFVDQPGWILVNEHLIGRTILDMDGRRIEVVNDVHLLETKEKMIIVHVDISFNGFLRKWGFRRIRVMKDQLIPWKYVQPLSLEDAGSKDKVSLSITRNQIKELPAEDLADALEELSGEEQQAVFSALDSETAAETLIEAEPRAKRQLMSNLRKERAQNILSEMSIPQLANLFSVLPNDDVIELIQLVPIADAEKISKILSEKEETARVMMTSNYLAAPKEKTTGEILKSLKNSDVDRSNISYIYVIAPEDNTLLGVVDLRELVIAPDETTLADIMVSPVVTAEEEDLRDDLEELFAKYHYRMIPIVDRHDKLLGVIKDKDILAGAD
ncbi:MAG: CBS domain-containing protein [Ignavibacteriales bacterium]|nr:CBS domain-containing protein [Ignavibacteriales bacterium]